MDIATMHFWGKTKYWWALIITGILMIPCGLWLWFQPALGYEVLSLLLGWLLILFGIVQLIVSGKSSRMGLVACRWNYRYTYRVYISREFIFQRGCASFLFCLYFYV